MANDITNVTPLILRKAVMALRQNAKFVGLVDRSYSDELVEPGDPIRIPIPKPAQSYDVVPGTPTTLTDVSPNKVELTPSVWKASRFALSDKEIADMDRDSAIPSSLSEAAKKLVNDIDNEIITQILNGVGGIHGQVDETAFDTQADITSLGKVLDDQLCPEDDRQLVLSPAAKAAFLNLDNFTLSNNTGATPAPIRTGRIGEALGFEWHMDQNLRGKAHANGTVGASSTQAENEADTNGALAAGAKSMAIDGAGLASGTITKGTVFSFASISDLTFVVTSDVTLSSNAGTVAFSPQLPEAVADGVKISFYKSYNLSAVGFHPMGIGLGFRPIPDSTVIQLSQMGVIVEDYVDPMTNVALRLKIEHANNQTSWELQTMFGAAIVRPELVAKGVQYTGNGSFPA